MQTQGSCGRGARYYGDELAVLRGRLASEHHEHPPEPAGDDDPEEVLTCEHGVPMAQVHKCRDCQWLFGWGHQRPR